MLRHLNVYLEEWCNMESRMRKYFKVNVEKYVCGKAFNVYRPASLNAPKDEAVMFVTEGFLDKSEALLHNNHCLVFWPQNVEVPEYILEHHAVVKCKDPHMSYCKFYQENNIVYLPKKEKYQCIEGAYIAENAKIGENVVIFPGAYIGGETIVGNNVYIGSGVKIVGEVIIGNNVVIRENSVIGADGLSTDRDENGHAVTMPQFGGVILEDDVQIGANTTIARGAIDNTIICKGCKIDNSSFISHNVQMGADTFVVGESIMFGSSSTGERVYISGNSTIRNGIHIDDDAIIGMGAVVVKDVATKQVVKGNPAR